MLKFVTENEYMELTGAESIPENFNNLVIEASSYINKATFNRVDVNNMNEAVKYATCLIINKINQSIQLKNEIGNLKSQNIEGWSESYMTPDEIDTTLEKEKGQIIEKYLWNVEGIDGKPLLYRGVCL